MRLHCHGDGPRTFREPAGAMGTSGDSDPAASGWRGHSPPSTTVVTALLPQTPS
jgi:hypothetical protein